MNKSVATYTFGLLLGLLLGWAPHAEAGTTFFLFARYQAPSSPPLPAGCTPDTSPNATFQNKVENRSTSEALWFTCRNIPSAQARPESVLGLRLEVFDLNAGTTRAKALSECDLASDALYQGPIQRTTGPMLDAQILTIGHPWPPTCTRSRIRVLLPPRGQGTNGSSLRSFTGFF